MGTSLIIDSCSLLLICSPKVFHDCSAKFTTGDFECIVCLKKLYIYIPQRYSPEEPRPTEVVAARWPCGQPSDYPSTLISVFLTGFRYFSYQVATQLSSRGWVDSVPDPILPEKILGYSRESNPGLLGQQSGHIYIYSVLQHLPAPN